MSSSSDPPPRSAGQILLVVLGIVLSLLALTLPGTPAGTAPVPLMVAAFSSPIRRLHDVVPLALLVVLLAALIVPHVVLVRAVVRRWSSPGDRIVLIASGVVAVLWGLYFTAFVFTPATYRLIPLVLSILLAGAVLLIDQWAVCTRLIPGYGRGFRS